MTRKRFSPLIFFDFVIFSMMVLALFVYYRGSADLGFYGVLNQSLLAFFSIFGIRIIMRIYGQIWRYGGVLCYIRLLAADSIAFVIYFCAESLLPVQHISLPKMIAFCSMNTLASLSMRLCYRYVYKNGSRPDRWGAVLRCLLKVFSGGRVQHEMDPDNQRIRIAVIGAGTAGVGLAEDLLSNPKSQYIPRCFVDNDASKVGRDIHGLAVLSEDEATLSELHTRHIQQVVFAVPDMTQARRMELVDYYQRAGFQIKVYDYPALDAPDQKKQLRDFEISDLLMRCEKSVISDKTREYYENKVILITGGGGSIGSELCCQLAKMGPKCLIVLDIYENCAYDLQQSLILAYKGRLDVRVEIASICDKQALARCFRKYRPDICINAAAHKHVPLMETNCIEAVANNVFGTLNVIQCCEEYGCSRFMMVSTDKAVNPTNVMGATKRACEMIMQAYSTRGIVRCSATRFGNVLGSAGSVIPLFKRQIAAGGPITLTDKRIIRYFMTIPEASQLVLTSGAMANNGDLFVLDMGAPVKIYDLARNMIALSGAQNIEIVETGLRPGEKLYEELLVQKDSLEKTENDLIFIEHEVPVTMEELSEKLALLTEAIEADSDDDMRECLRKVVPTFRRPEEVNAKL